MNRDESFARVSLVFGKSNTAAFQFAMLDSLNDLLLNPPTAFTAHVQYELPSVDSLGIALEDAGVSIGRGSNVKYNTLLTALTTVFGGPSALQLNRRDHHRMLQALSRSPENQVVNVAMFMNLYGDWCKQRKLDDRNSSVSVSGSGGAASRIASSSSSSSSLHASALPLLDARNVHSQLQLLVPDSMFIFDLIRTRLSRALQHIAALSDRLSVKDLSKLMRDASIIVPVQRLEAVLSALKGDHFGVYSTTATATAAATSASVSSSVSNSNSNLLTLKASALLRVCIACEQGHVLLTSDHHFHKQEHQRRMHTSSCIRSLQRVWPAVQAHLLHSLASASSSSASSFNSVTSGAYFSAAAAEGVRLAPADCTLVWSQLHKEASDTSTGTYITEGEETTLSMSELHAIFDADLSLRMEQDANIASHNSLMTPLTHNRSHSHQNSNGNGNDRYNDTHVHENDDSHFLFLQGSNKNITGIVQHRRHIDSNVCRQQHGVHDTVGQYLQWSSEIPLSPHASTKEGAGKCGGLPWEVHHEDNVGADNTSNNTSTSEEGRDRQQSLPWMTPHNDEGHVANNICYRLLHRLKSLSTADFTHLVHLLINSENSSSNSNSSSSRTNAKDRDRDRDDGKSKGIGISRSQIVEAFADVGVHIDMKHASILYQNVSGNGQNPVYVSSLFQWLDRAQGQGQVQGDADGDGVVARLNMTMANLKLKSTTATPVTLPVHAPVQAKTVKAAAGSATVKQAWDFNTTVAVTKAEENTILDDNKNEAADGVNADDSLDGIGSHVGKATSVFAPPSLSPSLSPSSVPIKSSNSINNNDISVISAASNSRSPAPKVFTRLVSAAFQQNRHRNEESHVFDGAMKQLSRLGKFEEAQAQSDEHNQQQHQSQGERRHTTENNSGYETANRRVVTAAGPSPPLVSDVSTAVFDILQNKRAGLALLFRRLVSECGDKGSTGNNGSGLVPLLAFAASLSEFISSTNTALAKHLSEIPILTHKIACDIVNCAYTEDLTRIFIHFKDVTMFLDAIKGESSRGDQSSTMLRRLKDKCHVASCLQGEKLRLLMLTPQLRQRLKHRYLSGKSLGFQHGGGGSNGSNKDYCSAQDLIDVFTCVEVHLTHSEAEFLCATTCDINVNDVNIGIVHGGNCNSNRSAALEAGTSLGAVIRYLSEQVLI